MKIARILIIILIGILLLSVAYPGSAAGKNPHVDPADSPHAKPADNPHPKPTDTPEPTEIPTETPTITEPPTTAEPTESPTEVPTQTETTVTTTETTATPSLTENPTASPAPAPDSGGGSGGGGGADTGSTENVRSGSSGGAEATGVGFFIIPTEVPTLPAEWYSCDIRGAGLTSTEGGKQKITLDLHSARDTVEIRTNQIVSRNNGLQITVETEEILTPVDGIISGTVKNVDIKTDPILGDIKEVGGKFLVMVETTSHEAPSHSSRIKVTLSETPTGDLLNYFQDGAKQQGVEINRFAYTMNVRTVNVSPFNPANLTMTVSPEWVTGMGGRDAVRIMRVTDEGKFQILDTKTAGYDQFGNIIFQARSPEGFSTFGLVGIVRLTGQLTIPTTLPLPLTTLPQPVVSIAPLSTLPPLNPLFFFIGSFIAASLVLEIAGLYFFAPKKSDL